MKAPGATRVAAGAFTPCFAAVVPEISALMMALKRALVRNESHGYLRGSKKLFCCCRCGTV